MAENQETLTQNQITFENEQTFDSDSQTVINFGATLAAGVVINGNEDSTLKIITRTAVLPDGRKAPQSYIVVRGVEYNLKNLRFANSKTRELNDLGKLLTSAIVADICNIFKQNIVTVVMFENVEEQTSNGIRYFTKCNVKVEPIIKEQQSKK